MNNIQARWSKIAAYLENIISYIFAAAVCVILCVIVFVDKNIKYACKKKVPADNWQLFLVIGAFVLGIMGAAYLFRHRIPACKIPGNRILKKWILKYPKMSWSVTWQKMQGKGNKIFFLCTIAVFAVQYYMIHAIFFRAGWDAGTLAFYGEGLANGTIPTLAGEEYFLRCPNNVFLTVIFKYLCKLNGAAGLGDASMLMAMVGVVLVDLAGILLFRLIQDYSSTKHAYAGYLLYVLLIALSPWIVVPYSDTYGIVFPIAVFYLYFKANKKGFHVFLIGFLAMLGSFIKPPVLIALIAILMQEAIGFMKQARWRRLWMLPIGCAGIAAALLLRSLAYQDVGFARDKDKELSIFHYFMMGQNDAANGVFLEEDTWYSYSMETQAERTKQNIRIGLQRIANRKLLGNMQFYTKKILTNFNDGTFAWGVEGNFYAVMTEPCDESAAPALRSYFYNEGEHHSDFMLIQQGIWLAMLAGVACSVLQKKRDNRISVLWTAFVGVFAYVMLFEARARYLYIYAPVLIVLAVVGLQSFQNARTVFFAHCRKTENVLN